MVACSTSFVLNAYNFLFLKRFAIYVWFAIAPLIWVVCPLTGAAWVTQTYLKYKLVVVNAWVDIPEVRILLALFFFSLDRNDCDIWHSYSLFSLKHYRIQLAVSKNRFLHNKKYAKDRVENETLATKLKVIPLK